MTRPNVLAALAMAALLVTAGCLGGAVDGTQTAAPNSDSTATDGTGSSGDATMSFYVSDRPGAIDDFEHLNVTITEVGLHRTGDVESDETETETENETETSTDSETETATDTSTTTTDTDTSTMTAEEPDETTHTMTDTMTNQSVDAKQEDTETETETDTETETETETETDDETESETETEESEGEDDSDDSEDAESSEGWTTYEVDSKTVDLTELRGANASKLADFQVQSGEYDKVFVYVSNVEGTLKNGEKVNVKLPSGKLQINKAFTVQEGENTQFVFDIMIHKAGNSGKYVLRPVISESGTGDQVEIDDVDDDSDDENEKKNENAGEGEDSDESESASELTAELQGQVKAGETVTLTVTNASGPVEGANVTVNGEAVGETDADGTLAIEVPDAEDLEVEVTSGDAETELERKIAGGNGNGGNGNGAVLPA
ncbi:DUF4382 domain-containing protein [Haloarchaeobius amylolyticus]|uniref:DUF4382 domain-containing protein n=1 Tax=Haloarchaeobius amylolyticus TaxID=1198296 RepID=UPI002270BCA5|nr:DUF4382 domain-containing protein [Haloarchaeobius amylolyticus]